MSDSLITKKAIASGLKELCLTKNFDKISVSDIAAVCGLNRQTFYYHFQDKFELLSWIYYNEGFLKVIDEISLTNWPDRLLILLKIMKENQVFYCNTIKNAEQYFYDYLFQIIRTLFLEAIEKLDKKNKMTVEEKRFTARFYSFGVCGVILDWVKSGMKADAAQISAQLKHLALHTEKLGYTRYSETME